MDNNVSTYSFHEGRSWDVDTVGILLILEDRRHDKYKLSFVRERSGYSYRL